MNVEQVTKRLTYKPGWTFRINGGNLIITAAVTHSTSLKPVTFDIRRLIPRVAQGNVEAYLSWIEDVIQEAEFHEMREFLRYDGRLIDDPHASEPA